MSRNIPKLTTVADEWSRLIGKPATDWERSCWQTAATYYRRKAETLAKRVAIIRTDDPEPYATADDQAADLRAGRFLVSTAFCDNDGWSPESNVDYRIVHDIIGHGATDPVPFTVAGELVAWQRQRSDLLSDVACGVLPICDAVIIAQVGWTETVGQLAYAAVTGDFVEGSQPIGFLPSGLARTFAPAGVEDDR